MSCQSCKQKTKAEFSSENIKNKSNILSRIFYFILGVLVILFLTPIVFFIGVYMLFNTIVLDKATDILPSLSYIGKILNKNNEDIDEDTDEDIDEDIDNYELIGVEEIKNKNNK